MYTETQTDTNKKTQTDIYIVHPQREKHTDTHINTNTQIIFRDTGMHCEQRREEEREERDSKGKQTARAPCSLACVRPRVQSPAPHRRDKMKPNSSARC